MNLLLDTHVFIWWDDSDDRLPINVLTALSDPNNTIFLSLVSIWEMQIKSQLGKLRFDIPLKRKIDEQRERNGLKILPISEGHIYSLDELPHHHRDPFDRLLIAQVQSEDLILVTHDAKIRAYDVSILWEND